MEGDSTGGETVGERDSDGEGVGDGEDITGDCGLGGGRLGVGFWTPISLNCSLQVMTTPNYNGA